MKKKYSLHFEDSPQQGIFKYRTEKKVSAGGVIYRYIGGKIEIALISVKGGKIWCLPKGEVTRKESIEETALREVREETGLDGRLIEKIGDVEYWYYSKEDAVRYHKFVHFYLIEYSGGDVEKHDWEVDEVRWFGINDAIDILSYKSEKEILQKVKIMAEIRR